MPRNVRERGGVATGPVSAPVRGAPDRAAPDYTAGMSTTGSDLPHLETDVPGPRSQALVDVLARHECPAVTARRARRAAALGVASDDPVVWSEAIGANVVDADGNRFVDLTSGFGVAFVGHRHPAVVRAVSEQTSRLLHAAGDAWPDVARIRLLEVLAQVTPGDLSVSLLGLSGADAVDAAVKTAVLATGRPGVLVFEGGYHGLALGVLGLQAYKAAFTSPFADRVVSAQALPFGCPPEQVRDALSGGTIGLVLVEPLQGRGGMRIPPDGWLAAVAAEVRAAGAVLAFDEIQCGLGRTGAWFASEHEGVIPDLMCVGKALGGGFPLSACVGTPDVMAAWGASKGEALHTQTFLGHPIGCAAALAVLELIDDAGLVDWAATRGAKLRVALEEVGFSVRGRGLMLGVELGASSFAVSRELLKRGYLTLPAGMEAEVLALTPPVCLTDVQVDGFVSALLEIRGQGGEATPVA